MYKQYCHSKIKYIILCLLSYLFMQNVHATFRAQVDRTHINEDESVKLILEIDTQTSSQPDLTALEKEFDVLSTSQSSHMSIINGYASNKTRWIIDLFPKRHGKLFIPELSYQGQKTQLIEINVTKASKSIKNNNGSHKEVFLTLEIDEPNPYVQQQVLLTLTLFYQESSSNHGIIEPRGKISDLNLPNTVIINIEERDNERVILSGKAYTAIKFYFLLFPQKSGILDIPPMRFKGMLQQSQLGSFFRNQQGKPILIQSSSQTLEVKSKPESYPSNIPWIPAKSVFLKDSWSDNKRQLNAGQAITRTIEFKLFGQSSNLWPNLDYTNLTAGQAKVYSDQAVAEDEPLKKDLIGKKIISYAIVPTGSGDVHLPEQKIYWWNTISDTLETLVIPGKQWISTATQPQINNIQTLEQHQNLNTVAEPNSKPVKTVNSTEKLVTEPTKIHNNIWHWLTATFALLWLAALVSLYRLKKQNKDTNDKQIPKKLARQQSLKKLQQACQSNDLIKIKETLINWAKIHYENLNILSLGDVSKCCDDKNKNLEQALIALNDQLYNPQPEKQFNAAFLLKSVYLQSTTKKTQKEHSGPLNPMYPNLT